MTRRGHAITAHDSLFGDDVTDRDDHSSQAPRREITPCGLLDARIRPPGSKSLTNRALVCAAAAEGVSRLTGVLDSEDVQVMVAALNSVGVAVEHDAAASVAVVTGRGGPITTPAPADLYIANSGTTVRFLTALLAAGQGTFRLHGTPRMHERPIDALLKALAGLGAQATSERSDGCPPVVLRAAGLDGGVVEVAGDVSSQYLSGLLMAAPLARADVEIRVIGELVSRPYVDMTLAVMQAFGATAATSDDMRTLRVPAPRGYRAADYAVEPDASAASYFFAAAAIAGGRVVVEGLSRDSLQGDVAFCDCLQAMGCEVRWGVDEIKVVGGPLRGGDFNMNAISDTVQTLAAVALFAEGPTTITGVAHNRHKETDRIGDLARELRKLGATVDEFDDGLRITPGELRPAEIATYHDHRMAMSLALVGLRQAGVVILDPGCTAKTYPRFFEDLASVTRAP